MYLQEKQLGSRQWPRNRRNPYNPCHDAAAVFQLILSHLRMRYIIYLFISQPVVELYHNVTAQ